MAKTEIQTIQDMHDFMNDVNSEIYNGASLCTLEQQVYEVKIKLKRKDNIPPYWSNICDELLKNIDHARKMNTRK